MLTILIRKARELVILTYCVVSPGIVVRCIALPSDQLFGVKQLSVRPCPYLIWNGTQRYRERVALTRCTYGPITVGSRSTNIALGTYFPVEVSLKNVLKLSFSSPTETSAGMFPSGRMPCSRQYSSQQAFPIWTPACPMCMDTHSRWKKTHGFPAHLTNLLRIDPGNFLTEIMEKRERCRKSVL